MLIWKLLHILSMVTMITAFIGAQVFYATAVRRQDVRALAFVQASIERAAVGIIALLGMVLGIVFGVLAATTGAFALDEGWLIVAYVLVAAFFVNSFLIGGAVVRAGKQAIEAEAGARPTEDVFQGVDANRGVILVSINIVIFVAVIADMVLKPF